MSAARRGYAVALRVRYARRGMPWRLHDQTIRIDPRVRHFIPHASEESLFRFMQRVVKRNDTVLDIGAFLGVYAILEGRRAGPGGRVVAVEPTGWSAAIARRHVGYNTRDCAPITLVEAAAGDTGGDAMLFEYDQPYVNSLAAAVDVDSEATHRRVGMTTIDDLCRRLDIVPDFIRMDVQGAEFHALRGARQTIRAAARRLTIVAEMHPQCWPAFGIDARRARETIRELGLRATPLTIGAELFTRDGHIVLRAAGA